MIRIENVETVGWRHAIRGMRNPLNSWDKSDSFPCNEDEPSKFCIGNEDFSLMKRLSKAGADHRKFMRMIVVYADITAPLYWWKEFDTYKVGTVRNSCSTMHKIHSKAFTLDDFSHEHLSLVCESTLKETIRTMNNARLYFLGTKDKEDWWQMIQILPSSYNQRATVMLSYEVLANMYHSRRKHKLDEWRYFCEWIEELPYSEIITGNEGTK